jgi:hypothetical protein
MKVSSQNFFCTINLQWVTVPQQQQEGLSQGWVKAGALTRSGLTVLSNKVNSNCVPSVYTYIINVNFIYKYNLINYKIKLMLRKGTLLSYIYFLLMLG